MVARDLLDKVSSCRWRPPHGDREACELNVKFHHLRTLGRGSHASTSQVARGFALESEGQMEVEHREVTRPARKPKRKAAKSPPNPGEEQ